MWVRFLLKLQNLLEEYRESSMIHRVSGNICKHTSYHQVNMFWEAGPTCKHSQLLKTTQVWAYTQNSNWLARTILNSLYSQILKIVSMHSQTGILVRSCVMPVQADSTAYTFLHKSYVQFMYSKSKNVRKHKLKDDKALFTKKHFSD